MLTVCVCVPEWSTDRKARSLGGPLTKPHSWYFRPPGRYLMTHMRLREKFLRHSFLSTVTFSFETPFWFLSEEIPFESYWNGKIYVICWYSFTQPPDCLGSRVLLSHNNIHYAVNIIAKAVNRDVRPDRLLRSRSRRDTAGTCWRRGCRMESVFSLKISVQLCLHPVSPSRTKAYSYLLLQPPEFLLHPV